MIVNGGKRITPTLIDRVQDRRGITIFRHDERECKYCEGDKSNRLQIPSEAIKDSREQIISSSSAYQMVSMLKGAVKRGTGVIVNSIGRGRNISEIARIVCTTNNDGSSGVRAETDQTNVSIIDLLDDE